MTTGDVDHHGHERARVGEPDPVRQVQHRRDRTRLIRAIEPREWPRQLTRRARRGGAARPAVPVRRRVDLRPRTAEHVDAGELGHEQAVVDEDAIGRQGRGRRSAPGLVRGRRDVGPVISRATRRRTNWRCRNGHLGRGMHIRSATLQATEGGIAWWASNSAADRFRHPARHRSFERRRRLLLPSSRSSCRGCGRSPSSTMSVPASSDGLRERPHHRWQTSLDNSCSQGRPSPSPGCWPG